MINKNISTRKVSNEALVEFHSTRIMTENSIREHSDKLYSIKVLSTVLLLLISTFLSAGIEPIKNGWAGEVLDAGATVLVEDDQYDYMNEVGQAVWSQKFTNYWVKNYLRAEVDETLLENVPIGAYDINLVVEVTPYELDGTPQSPSTYTLHLTYDPDNASVHDQVTHVLPLSVAYHRFEMKLLRIEDNNNGGAEIDSPGNVSLYGEIETARYYSYDITQNYFSQAGSVDHIVSNGDLRIFWNMIEGAEAYDLEWTYINSYNEDGTEKLENTIPFSDETFRYNSTRVTIADTRYQIPLVYPMGYVVYRVRPVFKQAPDFNKNAYCKWSTDDGSTKVSLADYVAKYHIQNAFELGLKNYQYTGSFAEEGKRNDLITYADGSLRSRQVVTRLNSIEKAVVGETMYDYQGRAAVNILPVPTDNNLLDYRIKFNQNTSGDKYSRKDFDEDTDDCEADTKGLHHTSGAGKYYSFNNAPTGNYQDYVPDAQGFPLSRVEYEPDNTGRVRRQGGVGLHHQLGTGHETQNLYAQPFQVELDRLFGYEVGYKTRYKKNMVIDPNGQVSISYLDPQGRVIATALAGKSPDNMENLEGADGTNLAVDSKSTLMVDLLNKDNWSDPDTPADDNQLQISGAFGKLQDQLVLTSRVPSLNTDETVKTNFYYDITHKVYDPNCGLACYPVVYDLEIIVKDECQKDLLTDIEGNKGPFVRSLGGGSGCADVNASFGPNDGLDAVMTTGTYDVSKTLSVNKEALEGYVDDYIQQGQANDCILEYQDFETRELAEIDPEDCEDDFDGQNYDIYTPCQAAYDQMLSDVKPRGQYGSLKGNQDVSVYNIDNQLPKNGNQTANWKNPVYLTGAIATYLDEQGNISYVEVEKQDDGTYIPEVDAGATVFFDGDRHHVYPQNLKNLSDFLKVWETSWAEQLVYYHPEICYYGWCQLLDKEYVQDDKYSISSHFDGIVLALNTYEQATFITNAGDADYLSPYDVTTIGNSSDPFFSQVIQELGVVSEAKAMMDDFYTDYSGSGHSMWNFAYYTIMCGGLYDDLASCPNQPPADFSTIPTAELDKIWQVFASYYQSAKQQVIDRLIHQYAKDNDCFNGCIGSGNSYDPFADALIEEVAGASSDVLEGEFFDADQNCSGDSYDLYGHKDPRFPSIDMAGPIHTGGAAWQGAQDMKEITEYNLYKEWGVCPLAIHLQALLEGMNEEGLMTTRLLNTLPAFSYDLYQEISGLDPMNGMGALSYEQYEWTTAVRASGSQLEVSINPLNSAPLVCGEILLNLPTYSQLDWNDFGADWWIDQMNQLVFTAGPNYSFAMKVRIKEDDGSGGFIYQEVVLQGNTCLPIGNCNLQDPDCGVDESAEDLMFLFNSLLKIDNGGTPALFSSTSAYDLGGATVGGANFFATYMGGGSLEDRMNPTNSIEDFDWEFLGINNGMDEFKFVDPSTTPNEHLIIRIMDPISSLGSGNIVRFANVRADKVASQEFKLDVYYMSGGEELYKTVRVTVADYNFGHQANMDWSFKDCCNEHGHKFAGGQLEDLINGVLNTTPPPSPPPGQSHSLITAEMRDYLGGDVWNISPKSVDLEEEVLLLPIINGDGEVICEIEIRFVDQDMVVAFYDDITSISDFEIAYDAPTGGKYYEATAIAHVNGGERRIRIRSCFELEPCGDCGIPTPLAPRDCRAEYNTYLNDFGAVFPHPCGGSPCPLGTSSPFYVDEETFCDMGIVHHYQDYLTYLQDFGLTEADTDKTEYVSIIQFSLGGYQDYVAKYKAYVDGFDVFTTSVRPRMYGFKEFISFSFGTDCVTDYVAECVDMQTDVVANGPLAAEMMTDILDFCQGYPVDRRCPTSVEWPSAFPSIEGFEPNDPCEEFAQNVAKANAKTLYDRYITDMRQQFREEYLAFALSSVVENFRMETIDNEYHYTLYYYDKSGNLTRTVPPQGVERIEDAQTLTQIKMERASGTQTAVTETNHRMMTTYHYNSLNQLSKQQTPDGGSSEFWYDALGRLVASQNAKQKTNNQYSYTAYDALGRVVEVGQLTAASVPTEAQLNDEIFPNTWSTNRTEVMLTYYDEVDAGFFQGASPFAGMQRNLRNRIARVTYQENLVFSPSAPGTFVYNEQAYDRASHYSYDEHGNVDELVQEIKDPKLVALGQQYRKLDYVYDLISGNVLEVKYQDGEDDAFYHKYSYDADNRITEVETSSDAISWTNDARYFYYDHGPLARTEIGDNNVQGCDHVYTIQGWLKSVNTNNLSEVNDVGSDGAVGSVNEKFGKDVHGFSLEYFATDYQSRSGKSAFHSDLDDITYTNLYNGNIGQMATSLRDLNGDKMGLIANNYTYDQLQRLQSMQSHLAVNGVAGLSTYTDLSPSDKYSVQLDYDQNGNILKLNRAGNLSHTSGYDMDQFTYFYYKKDGTIYDPIAETPADATNQLAYVSDAISNTSLYTEDLDPQLSMNYSYDEIGQLIEDKAEEIASIEWTAQHKISKVIRTTNNHNKADLEFRYDVMGNRVVKIVKPRIAGVLSPVSDWTYTYYSRDAQGNVMATYQLKEEGGSDKLYLEEKNIYGSDRVGMIQTHELLVGSGTPPPMTSGYPAFSGQKRFELSNHLGNVLSVVSDKKYYDTRTYTLEDMETIAPPWFNNGDVVLSLEDDGSGSGKKKLKVDQVEQYEGITYFMNTQVGERYIVSVDIEMGSLTELELSARETLGAGTGDVLASRQITIDGNYAIEFVATTTSTHLIFEQDDPNMTTEGHFFLDNLRVDGPGQINSTIDYVANIESVSDYYPFGMQMPDRTFSGNYRYGFQGQETDDEWLGGAVSFKYRVHDARIGRFLSVDPLSPSYPWYSPYHFSGNKLIWAMELEGLEEAIATDYMKKVKLRDAEGKLVEQEVYFRRIQLTGKTGPDDLGKIHITYSDGTNEMVEMNAGERKLVDRIKKSSEGFEESSVAEKDLARHVKLKGPTSKKIETKTLYTGVYDAALVDEKNMEGVVGELVANESKIKSLTLTISPYDDYASLQFAKEELEHRLNDAGVSTLEIKKVPGKDPSSFSGYDGQPSVDIKIEYKSYDGRGE